jgi:hypothetical protein
VALSGQIAGVWPDQGLDQAGERGEEKKGRSRKCSPRAGRSRFGRISSSGGGELAGSAPGGGGGARGGRAGKGAGLGRAGARALPFIGAGEAAPGVHNTPAEGGGGLARDATAKSRAGSVGPRWASTGLRLGRPRCGLGRALFFSKYFSNVKTNSKIRENAYKARKYSKNHKNSRKIPRDTLGHEQSK